MDYNYSQLKDRWSEYKLRTDERPKLQYEYFVSGSGEFPWDMLRYDACWPVDSIAASKMGIGFHDNGAAAYKKIRSIRLRSYKPPTVARWSSFTWSVGNEDLGR